MGRRNRVGTLNDEGFVKPTFQSNVGKEMVTNKVNELVDEKLNRKVHDLTIIPELEFFIRKLNENEFSALESDILQNGCLDPIRIWENNGEKIIVDGHHRYEICHKHEKPFSIESLSFKDIEEVKEWMIVNQLGRRNVNKESKIYLIGLHYNLNKRAVGRYSENGVQSDHLSKVHQLSKRSLIDNANCATLIDRLDEATRNNFLEGKTTYKKIHLLDAYKVLSEDEKASEIKIFLDRVSVSSKEKNDTPKVSGKGTKQVNHFESYQQKFQNTTVAVIKKLKLEEKEKMRAFLQSQLEVLEQNIEEEKSGKQ